MMASEHWLVAKNPEPNALGYVLMMRANTTADWTVLPGGGIKSRWAKEAFNAAVKQGISIDVTVNPGDPKAVMRDAEAIDADQELTLICRESARNPDRWSVMTMDVAGAFRVFKTVAGNGIERLLEDLAGSVSDSPLDKSVYWLRPDFHAEDLLPTKVEG